jgi:hypothetical protein
MKTFINLGLDNRIDGTVSLNTVHVVEGSRNNPDPEMTLARAIVSCMA